MAKGFIYTFYILFVFSACQNSEFVTFRDLSHDILFKKNGFDVVDDMVINYVRQGSKAVIKHHVKKGRLNGKCSGYNSAGDIEIEGHYKNGQMHGKWIKWYENGNKKFEVHYSNGLLDGDYTTYHENGQIKERGVYSKNTQQGKWEVYNINGDLIKSYVNDASITSAL